ncbi:MAG: peptidylprolyl isomerase [Thermoanaerobaculia bacterium]
MKLGILTIFCLVALIGSVHTAESGSNPRVRLATSMGDIVIELYADKAPASAANFLEYTRSGFYDGTIFHRIIDGFMCQGGGFMEGMKKKPTRDPIANEADNGLKNSRGTLAMARTSDPQSATAQFFINLVDNRALDHTSKTDQGWGYAVFGAVVEGMDVVDKMAKVPTGRQVGMRDVPTDPVIIRRASVE